MEIRTTHKTLRHALLCAGAALLAACATATPYQPASEPGAFDGFSQQMIENDRARITFAGNSLTKRETVENYLLYRAAETTLERGYDWFELVERDTESKTRYRGSSLGPNFYDPFFDYSFFHPRFGWGPGFRYSRFGGYYGFGRFGRPGFHGGFGRGFDDFDVREINKYRTTAEVRFGNGPKPEEAPNAFTAREVIANLGPTIRLPEAES
ncbi:hypothetical protein [uncultured Algimonas sp.]|uniref:CC0125/CC1285 family lipoprotein n=1 Tax=uncultured Algimonas sp. TaxID=1547920 RepID=UPI0026128CB1|nr:hypothetical protein [uncultured Algimonas sp.]